MLRWDHSLVGDEEVTAHLVPFDGSDDVLEWMHVRPLDAPDPVYFEANLTTIRQVDYPDNDVLWPIMSGRMREVLLHGGALAHRVVPVSFLDDTVRPELRFDARGLPRAGVAVEGFGAVQLLEHLPEVIDLERSEVEPHPRLPGRLRRIDRLVFKNVSLPRIFRLAEYPSPLFVSLEARDALARAGVSGVQFWNLDRIL